MSIYDVEQDTVGASIQELLLRVDEIPTSLVLAQAANESAWGTSRFAQDGHNYFGQWCFKQGCGITPSNRAPGATHEVKRFNTPMDSVHAYFININTHRAYKTLREIRASAEKPVSGVLLADGLLNYSERKQAYIDELKSMIISNNLE